MKPYAFVVSVLVVFLGLSFAGCNGSQPSPVSPWCAVIAPVDSALVSGVSAWGQCTNPSAILASFQALEKCSIPAPAPSSSPAPMSAMMFGPVSSLCSAVAPAIIAAVVPSVQGAVIPAEWGCNAASTVAALQAAASTLCGLIPASQIKGK